MKQKLNRNILKASLAITFATFLMGNTQCEQPVDNKRQLKKNVRIVEVSASSFLNNGGFNFSEVAQSQLSGVLFENNNFYERTVYPDLNQIDGANNGGLKDQKYFGVQKTSVDSKVITQLKTWFPTMKAKEILLDRESSCFIQRPQHFVIGKINSLEAHSGGGLSFGFTPSGFTLPIEANVRIDRMRMDLSFHGIDPWTQQTSSSVNSEALKNDFKVGFGIPLGMFHIGAEFYRVTGMAETVLKGLKKAMTDLAKKLLSTPRQEWSTRIIYSRDNYVAILGGAELGLKKGDQLKVFNEVHTWNGEACGDSSVLTGSMIVSDASNPWIIEVEDAGNLISKAKVLNINENESIGTGALVQLHQFVKDVASKSAR